MKRGVRMMKGGRWLKTGMMILMIALAVGCSNRTPSDSPRAGVLVEDFQFHLLPSGARILTGWLYNPTGAEIRHAQIQVSLYDADNRRLSGMIIHVADVSPGGRKKFRAAVDSNLDIRGARVFSILIP